MKCPMCSEWVVFPLRYHTCSIFKVKRNIKFMLGLTLVLVAGTAAVIRTCEKVEAPVQKSHVLILAPLPKVENPRLNRMVRYFKSKGNPYPEQMAVAVLETKRPR